MNKLFILIVIFVFYGIRLFANVVRRKKNDYIFVSLFVFLIPFGFIFFSFPDSSAIRTGAFNKSISLEPFMLLMLFMFVALLLKKRSINLKISKSSYVLLGLFLIAFITPFNFAKFETFYFLFRLILLFFSFYLLTRLYHIHTLNKGVFDGLLLCVWLQFILAICYPVLNMTQVLTIFKDSEDVLYYAMERGDRQSAIGIFGHPGNLGLFCCMSFSYFSASLIAGYKKRKSTIALILILIVIILSLSRTTWIAFVFMITLSWVAYKNKKRTLFTLRNLSVVLILVVVLSYIIIFFTPLGIYFVNDDFSNMQEARFTHWIAGWEIIKEHYLFGVGINSHLEYLNTAMPTLLSGFLSVNPIHNIHIVVFAETGIIGFILWLVFFIRTLESSKKSFHNSSIKQCKIFNMALFGILISFFIYGFFGWAGFQIEQLAMFLLFVYITSYCNLSQKNNKEIIGYKKN